MKRMVTMWMVLLVAALTGTAEIVAETDTTVRFRQPDGTEVELHKHPKRTVICFASLVDLWYAAGGSAVATVKVKSLDALPVAARDLPTVGAVTVPNPEEVLAQRPDLVLLNYKLERHRALAGLLRTNGIESVCVDYANYTDFAGLAELFERLNSGPAAPVAAVAAEVEAICAGCRSKSGPRLAIVFAAAAGFALETPATNTGVIAAMLGGRNIVSSADRGRIDFSYEQLLIDDPDVILVVTMGETEALQEKFRRELMDQPAWRELRASRDHRVHFLPADLFLYQPGTRYPEAFRYLAALLYPDREAE